MVRVRDGREGRRHYQLVRARLGLDQGEAARRIAENLGISTVKSDGSKGDNTKPPPKIYPYGEEGPPVGHNEIRRHYYPKNGTAKAEGQDQETECAQRQAMVDLLSGIPGQHAHRLAMGKAGKTTALYLRRRGTDMQRIFWPEGEKDADTLDGLELSVFTFGGGDGLRTTSKNTLSYSRTTAN